MKRQLAWALVGTFVLACGGEVEQDPTPNDEPPGGAGTTGLGGSGAGTRAKSRLGDCTPGTPMSKAKSCEWYAGQTCYSTKEAACNCICPTDVAEVFCISDMPEDGVGTSVYCTGG